VSITGSQVVEEVDSALLEGRKLRAIVDGDVHPTVADVSQLRHHMSKRAARRVFGEELGVYARDPNRIPHPTSGLRLDARTPGGGVPGSDPAYCNEQLMDRYDITAAVLTGIQSGLIISMGDETAGTEFCSALNRYLLEEWVDFDSRYRLAISVNPYDVVGAVREIEDLADVPGVCGIFVPHAGVAMGRTSLFPVYEAAAGHRLPVILHPTGGEGNLAQAPRLAGGLPATYPERHSLLLQPGQAVLASMIFGGIFDRFPDLRLVLSEYGFSWLPSMVATMDAAYEQGDGVLSGLAKPPSEYVWDNVRFTSQPLDEPERIEDLWLVLELARAETTLMFSSDYPHWDNDDPNVILTSRLPEHLRSRVAYQNALECFGPRLAIEL
jgi:predicted TIM-barrel fold metal-dependent hydrolase